jgi:hypothetical protein
MRDHYTDQQLAANMIARGVKLAKVLGHTPSMKQYRAAQILLSYERIQRVFGSFLAFQRAVARAIGDAAFFERAHYLGRPPLMDEREFLADPHEELGANLGLIDEGPCQCRSCEAYNNDPARQCQCRTATQECPACEAYRQAWEREKRRAAVG